MNIQKYTEKAQEAIASAQSVADREGHPEITPEHVLLALVEQEGGIVPGILRKLDADPSAVAAEIRAELGKNPAVHGGSQPGLSARLRRVADAAESEAGRLKDEYVSTEHLLLAIAGETGRTATAAHILQKHGASRDAILKALTSVRGSQRVTSQNPESTYQSLEKYGRDLTELARKGKLDPVIGRDDEIRRVIQVLSRRTKNNPVLIGEPGVGNFLQHGLQAFLELAAVLGSRDERAHVERDDLLVLETLRDVLPDDALREALDNSGLADAWFADENGIVLRAA